MGKLFINSDGKIELVEPLKKLHGVLCDTRFGSTKAGRVILLIGALISNLFTWPLQLIEVLLEQQYPNRFGNTKEEQEITNEFIQKHFG